MTMTNQIEKTIVIGSSPAMVWEALTQPELMKQWMGDPEMGIEIQTDWKVNSPIVITGFHHARFENRGVVLEYDRNIVLKYSHLSSLSRLEDKAINYSIIEFILTPLVNQTQLTLKIHNFPTETIFKHLDFYWNTAVHFIKKFVEKQIEALPQYR